MTYSSDDYTSSSSSQAPFAGDQTGDIFQSEENVVAQSPVTTVRMVETQSGFLVVLKDVDERVSLSVKRKIGTPPASQVLLTSDESLKLSRILTSGKAVLSSSPASVPSLSPISEPAASDYRVSPGLDRTPTANDAIQTLTADTHQTSDFSDLNRPDRKSRFSSDYSFGSDSGSEIGTEAISPRRAKEKKYLIFGGIGLVAMVIFMVGAAVFLFFNYSSSTAPEEAKEIAKSEMSSENVDTFVRTYVSNLLDFGPRSYRYSQVQAMSVMKPDLMKKYWNETNFPLSTRQLKRLPKGQAVVVNKVVQEPTSSVSTDVDIYAELTNKTAKEPTPIHLRLGISLNQEGKLVVVSQKDVSSEDKSKK